MAARVPRVIVLCSGSFFLAAAGLLEGRRAATHWSVAALQQQRYPAVDVDADAIVVRDGHLWTSAGVTACIDLALDVARDLVMYLKRPCGQSQFSVQFSSQAVQTGVVKAVQDYVLANLAEPLGLEVLAAQAWMSERHLRRVFQQETGHTPSAFVETGAPRRRKAAAAGASPPAAQDRRRARGPALEAGAAPSVRAAYGHHASGVSRALWRAQPLSLGAQGLAAFRTRQSCWMRHRQ